MQRLPHHSVNKQNIGKARALRKNLSDSEKKLKTLLNKKNTGYKFRFQHPVKQFILDFYCCSAKLCVEVDGEQHDQNKDKERDLIMESLGVLTYRVPSVDLWNADLLRVHLDTIFMLCKERTESAKENSD